MSSKFIFVGILLPILASIVQSFSNKENHEERQRRFDMVLFDYHLLDSHSGLSDRIRSTPYGVIVSMSTLHVVVVGRHS